MMPKRFISLLLFIGAACFTNCKQSKEKDIQNKPANADFSKYISIGESYSAGNVQSAELQKESPMALMAGQFAKIGGGQFKIPLHAIDLDVSDQGPYQNLAVPSTSSYHVTDKNFSSKSVFFKNISTSDRNSIMDEILLQTDRTFFSVWIGGNDLVQYASQGGLGVYRKNDEPLANYNLVIKMPNGDSITAQDLTSPKLFDKFYSEIVSKLTENGSQGVLISVSNVIDLPFFTTVPTKCITLSKRRAAELNKIYQQYNQKLEQLSETNPGLKSELISRKIEFEEGQGNSPVIIDEDLSVVGNLPKYRQANSSDIILLSAQKGISNSEIALGTDKPLEDQFVLIPSEIENINNACQSYNNTIKRLAEENKLAYGNLDTLMNKLKSPNGLTHENITYTIKNHGGFFSRDALPTISGNAFICNELIKVINNRYKVNIPFVNPTSFARN